MYLPDLTKIDWYFCAVNPEPWRVGPVGVNRHSGALRAYIGQDAQLHAYQEGIREELEGYAPTMLDSMRIGLVLYFWRDVPSYEGDRKKIKKHEADLTNLIKATEDACQGILFPNDILVERIVAHRVKQESEVAKPGVLIGVHSIPIDASLEPPPELGEVAMEKLMTPSVDAWEPPEGGSF